MKTHDTTSDNDYKSRAVSSDQQQKTDSEKTGPVPPGSAARRRHTDIINGSPYMVSQRKRLRNLSGQALQKQEGLEEEELMQGKSAAQRQPAEEEELMQGKFTAQRQPLEDEELMQGKFTAQRQPLEDEELMQGKFTAQRQPLEDEELMQGKFTAQRQPLEDEELMQGKFTAQRQPLEDEELMQGKFTAQKQPDENRTGIPDEMKASMESTLNTDFSDVRVHPNSGKATEVGALAYTQGTDVHFAPGQFKPESSAGRQLLGHELTHVVQQSQGRVQPTGEVAGLPVNDNPLLEKEADAMGAKVPKHKP